MRPPALWDAGQLSPEESAWEKAQARADIAAALAPWSGNLDTCPLYKKLAPQPTPDRRLSRVMSFTLAEYDTEYNGAGMSLLEFHALRKNADGLHRSLGDSLRWMEMQKARWQRERAAREQQAADEFFGSTQTC